ncbi:MAG: hypothetical protein JW700_02960 [Candidatus Aenigmarchaeota archaeon]|nr:hypothetical protein [Candidatus Aenigmarchaeota archaeon]
MNEWILISMVILGIITLLALVYVRKLSKNSWKHETDYRTFFTMGIIWLPLGIILDMPFFFIMSLVYIGIGLANKDKWGKKAKMTKQQKKIQIIAALSGLVLLVVFVAMMFVFGW